MWRSKPSTNSSRGLPVGLRQVVQQENKAIRNPVIHRTKCDSSNKNSISKTTCAWSNKMATSIAMMVPDNLRYHGHFNDGKLANRGIPQPSSHPAITKRWLGFIISRHESLWSISQKWFASSTSRQKFVNQPPMINKTTDDKSRYD